MEKYNFIRTTDEDTKSKLLELGFVLVSENNGYAIFVNETKLNFSSIDLTQLQFTNMLYV